MIIKGIDTLEFGIDVDFYFERLRNFLQELKALKLEAHETNKEPLIRIGNINLTVHRTGIRFYAYRLSCNDFQIYFMDKLMTENSPIRVKFMSSFLWSYGYKLAFDYFMDWLSHLNVRYNGNRISRLDICVDTDEVEFKLNDIKGIVSRARKKDKHFVDTEFMIGRKFSGFTIGKGLLHARVYNKTIEIKNSGKNWFTELWKESGYNGSNDIWRTEFQVRREVLKELKGTVKYYAQI